MGGQAKQGVREGREVVRVAEARSLSDPGLAIDIPPQTIDHRSASVQRLESQVKMSAADKERNQVRFETELEVGP
jgi:hypothetical protein